jgi:uncharacterized membrane protein YphA (DoxX/SURF4 family)
MTTLTSPVSNTPSRAALFHVRGIVYWAATLIVVVESAVGGLWWDLMRIPYVRETLAHLGYPIYFATIMGVAKGLAVVALLVPRFPRLKEWAYAGVFFVYVGAAASHFAVGDGANKWMSPIVLAVITLVSWALRPPARRDPVPSSNVSILARLFERS